MRVTGDQNTLDEIMKPFPAIVLLLIIWLSVAGCAPLSPPEPADAVTPVFLPTVTNQAALSPTPSPTPQPAVAPFYPLTPDQGPLLLLQTGFFEYHYLNPITQARFPFELPIADSQFRLRANLSPSGNRMFFPLDDHRGVTVDLRTGAVLHTYDFGGPELFNPEQVAVAAESLVTELNLTHAGLLEAVTQSHQSSRALLRWYQSDRYHLSVKDTGPITTSLYLDDHQTGSRLQLEDQPGFVEDYRVGPDGNHILLKKGFVFKPGAYRDKAYYLLNVANQTLQPIPLPEDIENPSLTWFNAESLGLIHHAFMAGGAGYSLIDTQTLQAKPIITGEFSDLRYFGENLLAIQQNSDPESTTFTLFSLQGEFVAAQTIEMLCFYQYPASDWIMFACELKSYLLDQNLNFQPFSDDVLNLTLSPDGNTFVMTNRSEQSFLLDTNLIVQSELTLAEQPLEIQWLQNSSGFLYRTHGRLHYYDLASQTSRLLLESDLFSDYANINFVWVNLD
jgi:hypothetical protein